jgi:hypothetical protein
MYSFDAVTTSGFFFLSGIVIGLFFRAPAVVAASIVVLATSLFASIWRSLSWQDGALQAAVLLLALHLGYLLGLLLISGRTKWRAAQQRPARPSIGISKLEHGGYGHKKNAQIADK